MPGGIDRRTYRQRRPAVSRAPTSSWWMPAATNCRAARSARSGFAAVRSSRATGTIRRRRPKVLPPASGIPAISARSTQQNFVRVFDRQKDMINRGGLKIYSAEVESVLAGHPDVVESAIIAKPCPVLGERVHAVIVTRAASVSGEALRAWCAERLSDYKVPETMDADRRAAAAQRQRQGDEEAVARGMGGGAIRRRLACLAGEELHLRRVGRGRRVNALIRLALPCHRHIARVSPPPRRDRA